MFNLKGSQGMETLVETAHGSSRSQLLASIAKQFRGDAVPEWVIFEYYRRVATDDLVGRSPQALSQAVYWHWRTAQVRQQGETIVGVFGPADREAGRDNANTVVEIVTDDMPFLIDTVKAELAREGRRVRLMAHPQLAVRRNTAGELQEAYEPGCADVKAGAITESWIHLEVDRLADSSDEEKLRTVLDRDLADTRRAVTDWQAMREACCVLARQLADDPPVGIAASVVERTRSLLQWLADDHFTFLGYREYELTRVDGQDVLQPLAPTGLGVLSDGPTLHSRTNRFTRLTSEVRSMARDRQLLVITKANSRSTVHRGEYLDYIGIKTFNGDGEVVGEKRILGLFTSRAYTASVRDVPVIRERVDEVLTRAGLATDSHSGKDLLEVIETYPRDELFQTNTSSLYEVANDVLHLQERRQAGVFFRRDDYGRFESCLVYLQRDRYTTGVRLAMENILCEVFGTRIVDHATRVTDSTLARIHFVVRVQLGAEVPEFDRDELRRRLLAAARTWTEDLEDAARAQLGDEAGRDLFVRYGRGLPEAYKEDFSPEQGLDDLKHMDSLGSTGTGQITLYREEGCDRRERRFKFFRREQLLLTEVLPVFTHLGVDVVDERPYEVKLSDGVTLHIYDFGLRATSEDAWTRTHVDGESGPFQEAFAAVWAGEAESDGFNRLVLGADLTWRQVVILRVVARYLRQIGSTFSQQYLEDALLANADLARRLVTLFETRFDPDHDFGVPARSRAAVEKEIVEAIIEGLGVVSSLDQDRIVRAFLGVVQGTLRTNYYQFPEKSYVSLKIDSSAVPGMPEPHPMCEVWVYSPRLEGVHLRFGKVARGGLRWSDRMEDFRTEVLGLVKAQLVKNAVIVPTGSKGGFVAKRLPDMSVDREAWLAEGIGAYEVFIAGMLDVTDNVVDGAVVPPQRVVRHDGDDTYLVVAADKGTAKFSDRANAVARSYHYWMDDAFASGGSAGYDHKGMGITARGAWESVRRHFRELGLDTQAEDFTTVGIGDMSGDVFGNGMLQSQHIRLIAAFDHRHIFVDPAPDSSRSFQERRRIFELARSSWADYDESLISEGGGVWSRTLKSVPISAQTAHALGLPTETAALTPTELLRAILQAPVDLLWNGGIGTYVKATTQTNSDIGDPTNDAIRVNGADLGCRVVGEGGNLGCSQLGRIEAALRGVRINTDAIDNSAGVDTSDHEVNIKILLAGTIRAGQLKTEQRDNFLLSMTDEVALEVLRDNYEQNVLLGNARAQSYPLLPVHTRLIGWLERHGDLDRGLEFLPTDDELLARHKGGIGLTSPELAVLTAYTKIALKHDLARSELPDETWLDGCLAEYFPEPIRSTFPAAPADHPLRREIVTNSVVNTLINGTDITFVLRAAEECGATLEQVVRAYFVCREIFDVESFIADVERLDNVADTTAQAVLYLELRRLMDRAVRWFVHNRPSKLDVTAEIERFKPVMRDFAPDVHTFLQGQERDRSALNAERIEQRGIPAALARKTASLLFQFSLLDVVEICEPGTDSHVAVPLYFAMSERFGIDARLSQVTRLPREGPWDALARGALREDLYAVLKSLARSALKVSGDDVTATERLSLWTVEHSDAIQRSKAALAEIDLLESPGISALTVALRSLRSILSVAKR